MGSLLVEYGDINNPVENPNGGEDIYPVFFIGIVNGLMQGSDAYINARLETGIDDMFNQVPFE